MFSHFMALSGFSGFLSSSLAALFIPILHLIFIWSFPKAQKHILQMFLTFFLVGIGWVLWMIRASIVAPIEWLTGLFWLTFLALGYMEAFSMLFRGFSLTIMADLYVRPRLSLEDVIQSYGNGQGGEWLLNKRLGSLEQMGLIEMDEFEIRECSARTRFLGRTGRAYKQFFNMGAGG